MEADDAQDHEGMVSLPVVVAKLSANVDALAEMVKELDRNVNGVEGMRMSFSVLTFDLAELRQELASVRTIGWRVIYVLALVGIVGFVLDSRIALDLYTHAAARR